MTDHLTTEHVADQAPELQTLAAEISAALRKFSAAHGDMRRGISILVCAVAQYTLAHYGHEGLKRCASGLLAYGRRNPNRGRMQ